MKEKKILKCVTLRDYLVANNNGLTVLLNCGALDGVLLDETIICVHQKQEDWWCDIFLEYTLSCNDLANITAAFAGYWWCVSPCYSHYGYRLSINLKGMLL